MFSGDVQRCRFWVTFVYFVYIVYIVRSCLRSGRSRFERSKSLTQLTATWNASLDPQGSCGQAVILMQAVLSCGALQDLINQKAFHWCRLIIG